MNGVETRMVDVLKELKQTYGAISVKAEFEAEGTRIEELLRLKEICMRSGLHMTLKIGGSESVRDMLEARSVGVDCLVAPMIESAYALRKYLQAVNKVFHEEYEAFEVSCNIETQHALSIIDEILSIKEIDLLDSIVIERVDLCHSMGMGDNMVNAGGVNEIVRKGFEAAVKRGKKCTVGGGLSADSLPFLKSLQLSNMLRYETRKVSFQAEKALANNPERGILKALGFELLWLKNKLNYYKSINRADLNRVTLIENNYQAAIDALI